MHQDVPASVIYLQDMRDVAEQVNTMATARFALPFSKSDKQWLHHVNNLGHWKRLSIYDAFLATVYTLFGNGVLLLMTGCHGILPTSAPDLSLTAPSVSIVGPTQVRQGSSALYRAFVTGLPSQSVNWLVNGILGGNDQVGTISSSGIYVASASADVISISCTSTASPSVSSSVTVSILSPFPVISSVTALRSDDRTVIVDIGGTGFMPQSVASVGETDSSTEFLSASELQASTQITSSGLKVEVTVSNPDPGAATSNEFEVTLPPSTLHQLVGCTNPNNPNANVPTSDWGTSANTEYFPLTQYSTPLIGTPTYTSNVIFWISREATPGDSVLMTGAFTESIKTAKVALIPTGTSDWRSLVHETGVVVPTTQQGTTGLFFMVPPKFPAGVYGFEIDDPIAPPLFSLANDPSIDWAVGVPSQIDPTSALQSSVHDCGVEPGELLRLFGKNFSSSSQVVLESSVGSIKSISPSALDSDSIVVKIPGTLRPGEYYVWVGSAPWSATSSLAVPITVVPPQSPRISDTRCASLIGDGQTDNTALLQLCMDQNAPMGGGSELVFISVPNGTFLLRSGVTIRTREILIGSSPSNTRFVGESPDTQPSAWFTIAPFAGLANLSISAPKALNLVASSDLSGNPTTSGHIFLRNVEFDSTPSGSNHDLSYMVALSGPDIQIYDSTFHSGSWGNLSILQGDGAVISGNSFNNEIAANYFQSSQNIIIEANSVYSGLGAGASSNPWGTPAFNFSRDMTVLSQSRVSRNEYIGYNTIQNIGQAGNNQVIQMDGGAGAYYGQVGTSTADTTVLADDPTWVYTGTGDLEGISVAIVLGTGVGQQSFIKSVNGRAITLATPWKVNPDSTSIVVIAASEDNLVIAHNTIANTLGTTMWLWRCVNAVIEDNELINSGTGIELAGIGPYAGPADFGPIMNTDILRNHIAIGSGDLLTDSLNENRGGIGIVDNYGIMISGLMVRDNVLPAIQTIYASNGWQGINADMIEKNNAEWIGFGFPVAGFLVQNNVSPGQ